MSRSNEEFLARPNDNRTTTTPWAVSRQSDRSSIMKSPKSSTSFSINSRKRSRPDSPRGGYGTASTSGAEIARTRHIATPHLDKPRRYESRYESQSRSSTARPSNVAQQNTSRIDEETVKSFIGTSGNKSGRSISIVVGSVQDNHSNESFTPSTSTAPATGTWGEFVYTTVGTFATKLYNFCFSNPFLGFKAGGGVGYDVSSGAPVQISHDQSHRNNHQVVHESSRSGTPVPGSYPEELISRDEKEDDLEVRSAKRLQTSQGTDWVVINHGRSSGQTTPTRSLSPAPIRANSAVSRSYLPRPSPRQSPSCAPRASMASTARPSLVSQTSSPRTTGDVARGSRASFASHRSSLSAASPGHEYSVSRAPNLAHSRPHTPPINPSVHQAPNSEQRSPSSLQLESDIQRYSQRRLKEERRNDKSMRRMNEAMRLMIRQGQDALKSQVDVDLDFDMDSDVEDEEMRGTVM